MTFASKKTCAAALSLALVLGTAGPAAGRAAAPPDQILFSSSFEEGDGLALLQDHVADAQNVNDAYQVGIRGNLTSLVRLDSIQGSGDRGNEGMQNLFDGSLSTKCLMVQQAAPTPENPAWVSFGLKEAAVVRSYALCAANDASERDPAAWTLYGSADGEAWTALDSREGQQFYNRKQENIYTFQNETPYAYYKLSVIQNGDSYMTQLAELKIGDGQGEMDVPVRRRVEGNIAPLILKTPSTAPPRRPARKMRISTTSSTTTQAPSS